VSQIDFPEWQLHRGYWQEGVRENTMEAFRQVKQKGCDMFECDVQLSRDGVPHVFHDFDLKRFFHVDQSVRATPSEDLQGLNVPTLEEVLTSSETPEFVNVEIKSIDFLARGVTLPILKVIGDHRENKTVLLSSFNPMCLFWAKRLLPQVPRALIVGSSRALLSWQFNVSVHLAEPDYINCSYRLIDRQDTRDRLLSFAKPVMVWTVNDPEKALFYLERGAISIISDILPPKSLK
jgi:glycerophosphoryl diester phosphodiesterase